MNISSLCTLLNNRLRNEMKNEKGFSIIRLHKFLQNSVFIYKIYAKYLCYSTACCSPGEYVARLVVRWSSAFGWQPRSREEQASRQVPVSPVPPSWIHPVTQVGRVWFEMKRWHLYSLLDLFSLSLFFFLFISTRFFQIAMHN